MVYKEYEIALKITDVTSVDAHNEAEAIAIAEDIFRENGYDLDRSYELDIINIRDTEV